MKDFGKRRKKLNRIEIPQGTEAWHQFRRGKISASKVPIILGISPYQTPLQLYEEEMGLREPQAQQAHMTRGLEVEDEVRDWFYFHSKIEVFPCVIQHADTPMFIASLDGMSADGKTIIEIKNNNKEYHEMAKEDKIPVNYMAQMQFQMYVCGLDKCHYISHRQGEFVEVMVYKSDVLLHDMIHKLHDFKRRLNDFDPPPLSDKDYEDMSHDSEINSMMAHYHNAQEKAKEWEVRADVCKKQILEKIGDRNAKGTNWKITKYSRQGNVDYDAILDHHNIDVDLSKFRKKGSISYRITIDGK